MSLQTEYRKLPSIDTLLQNPQITSLIDEYGHEQVVEGARTQLTQIRQAIAEGEQAPAQNEWFHILEQYLKALFQPTLIPTINATGVIIHTNLGRAPLSQAARSAVQALTQSYSNLEYDLNLGKRGSRYEHVREQLCRLTGAEDAIVVNNNAAAIYLVLSALCPAKNDNHSEVIVSRGQLVEIGGGFRIPDVLRESGATLVEVGTTNRTYDYDFAQAITPQTAALMQIHSSNFRQLGFVTQPALSDLVKIAQNYTQQNLEDPILVIDDQGSGTLLNTATYGLYPEPLVQDSLEQGADIVTFSGDKLLGGPQAGLIVGKRELINIIRRYPLTRALRVDKMTLAALEATLRSYERKQATAEIPIWQMISATVTQLKERVEKWQQMLIQNIDDHFTDRLHIWEGESAVGGGSLPGETLPTWLLAISVNQPDHSAAYLRKLETPIISRIQDEHLICDPRTVLPDQDEYLVTALTKMLRKKI